MPTADIYNAVKLFKKLDKTFLPKNYQRAVLEEFRSIKYTIGNKLSDFYDNLKTAYMKARPYADSSKMDEDGTAQLCKSIPPEVYAKCLSNFHLKGEDIASRYDELMSRLKCDNYVKVEKDSAKSAPTILKGNLKGDPSGPDQKKVTFDHLNYYQYDTRPSNNGQVDGNRNSRRPWNNRNRNSDSTRNRGENYTNNQRDTSLNRNTNQRCSTYSSLVCTYPRCGLRGHKEKDFRRKADDLHSMDFKESMVTNIKVVVESASLTV